MPVDAGPIDGRSAPDSGAAPDAEDLEPDASGVVEPTKCVADGSGRFVLQTSGGLDIDTVQGNDFFCPGSVGQDGSAFLNWVVPVRGNDLRAAFNVTIRNFARGETGNARPLQVTVLIAGAMGNIWDTTELCKVDIVGNTRVAGVAAMVYKVTGVIRCSGPIAGIRVGGPSLTIRTFEFTSSALYE